MRFEPGFMNDLRHDLARVRPDIKQRLARRGALTEEKLLSLVTYAGSVELDADHPGFGDVVNYDSLRSWQPACNAVRDGKIAFVVLASSVSSKTGAPKAFMRLPKLGIPLVAINLLQSGFVTLEGETIQAPTWFMTSPELTQRMANQLDGLSLTKEGVVFEQFQSYRLGVDYRLTFTEPGVPELYTTGDGDLAAALVESGVLDDNPNVEHVVIINSDNVLASLDPMILTHHLESRAAVTCEVIESKSPNAILAWVDNWLQVVDASLLSPEFVEDSRYRSTNSMIISTKALRTELPWSWNRQRKIVGNRIVVQHERLLEQYTSSFRTQYVLVEEARRYVSIETEDDLSRVDVILNGNR